MTGVTPCPACGAANPATHRFCHACGQPTQTVDQRHGSPSLSGVVREASGMAGTYGVDEGERRHLTVMFCDLVDSTPLAETLDAEDLHAVFQSYHKRCAEAVASHDGHVARYLGDGLLVYFGYPVAHEDDAQRAVRAGLEMIDAIASLNQQLSSSRRIRLALRIGIHSGEVVVGASGVAGLREKQVAGHTLHLAARLQTVAAPDSIVVSAATLRLLRDRFRSEDLGAHSLKGIAESVQVYRVVGSSDVPGRADAAARLTPLAGRDAELARLIDCWDLVRAGRGQSVLLHGEAGIGKSRLVRALRERLAAHRPLWLECRCSLYTRESALYPVIEMQQRTLGFRPGDSTERKLGRLERGLERAGLALPEAMPILASLHSLALPPGYAAPDLGPEGQRRKTLETLVEWLLHLGREQALVLVVEDLHWVDPSTLELLARVFDQLHATSVLALCTYRPDFTPPWAAESTVVALNRLNTFEMARMIEAAVGSKTLPEDSIREIARKSEGIPLFVEEFTKSVLERAESVPAGDRRMAMNLAIPATLQELLTARLDQLGGAKDLAQLCSVLGRGFSSELVRTVTQLDEAAVREALERLCAADLLVQRGDPSVPSYQFKHALIQEAAYRSLLRPQRQRYHQRVADVLAREIPGVVETQPELIAYHYTEAGVGETAIGFWLQAGQRAMVRWANVEAVNHLDHALALIAQRPDTVERCQLELAARMQQALGLIAIRGYGADEVERTFARARELCQRVGETPQLFPVMVGLWLFYLVRSEPTATSELAQQIFRFAERVGERDLLVEAHTVMAATAYWHGDQALAHEHAARSLALYDREQHSYLVLLYGQDPAVFAHLYVGLSAWHLGYPDQAVASVDQAIALAEAIGHRFTLAVGLLLANDMRYARRDAGPACRLAERAHALASEQGFPLQLWGAQTALGWCLVQAGRVEEGIAQLTEGLGKVAATGANVNGPFVASKLVEAYRRAGRFEQGLHAVDEALAISPRLLDRHWDAELHRQKGELLLEGWRDPVGAERSFHQALEVARAQGTRALELRAATSLADLWSAQGRRDDARRLLAGIYGWFTEGLDTQDLQDAKALLARLGSDLGSTHRDAAHHLDATGDAASIIAAARGGAKGTN